MSSIHYLRKIVTHAPKYLVRDVNQISSVHFPAQISERLKQHPLFESQRVADKYLLHWFNDGWKKTTETFSENWKSIKESTSRKNKKLVDGTKSIISGVSKSFKIKSNLVNDANSTTGKVSKSLKDQSEKLTSESKKLVDDASSKSLKSKVTKMVAKNNILADDAKSTIVGVSKSLEKSTAVASKTKDEVLGNVNKVIESTKSTVDETPNVKNKAQRALAENWDAIKRANSKNNKHIVDDLKESATSTVEEVSKSLKEKVDKSIDEKTKNIKKRIKKKADKLKQKISE